MVRKVTHRRNQHNDTGYLHLLHQKHWKTGDLSPSTAKIPSPITSDKMPWWYNPCNRIFGINITSEQAKQPVKIYYC
ncbi:hypothetical protein ACE6H2_023367 [Prunus campanulata]